MQNPQIWKPPGRWEAIWFWLRVRTLSALRTAADSRHGKPRFWPASSRLAEAPVVARLRTPLWSDGRADEFALVAGKVQNLRVAQPAFHAVEIPAGEILSFWRQLGAPRRSRGFVVGREIRSGCVVPTIAGGICQISNTLASCARRAGFELVERHGHSARIEANQDDGADLIDATVFWKHIDLRIRASHAWRIELELGADELIMTLRSHAAIPKTADAKWQTHALTPLAATGKETPVARSCATCQETACFRHRPGLAGPPDSLGQEAWLLDAWTPEFSHYLASQPEDAKRTVFTPARVTPRQRKQTGWHTGPHTRGARHSWPAFFTGMRRAIWLRLNASSPGKRQASLLDGQRWLASLYIERLSPTHRVLVIDQSLAPYLWRAGALAGRHYDVLAGALPIVEITRRLDRAAADWPAQASLRDFRADPELAAAEMAALRGARKLITAHAAVAAHLALCTGATVHRLAWILPEAGQPLAMQKNDVAEKTIVLGGSVLARKGACELAAAVQGLPCRVRVLGTLGTLGVDAEFWDGIDIKRAAPGHGGLAEAHVVVLPAHVEHAPRAALRALACGVPVIASEACGLAGLAGLTEIPSGDVQRLRAALISILWPERPYA